MTRLSSSKTSERKQQKTTEHNSSERFHRPTQADLVHNVLALQRTAGNRAVTHLLQQSLQSPGLVDDVPSIVHDVLNSPGQPLDAGTQASMEPRFGQDFSRIPPHTSTSGVIQAKLAINKPGDEYEREADRVADQVLEAPANPAASATPPRIQRFIGEAPGPADTVPASVDHILASSSRPLDPALRQDLEQRFGHDFSQVRVHSSAAAEQSAREVNANAYTVGHNIVFGAGQFAPGTHQGRRLIAHELTHVLQQSRSNSIRVGQSNEERGLSPEIATVEGKRLPTHELLHIQRSPADQPVVTGERTDDADAQVSLGYLDNAYVGKAAEELVGHTHWLVLREFLRGLWAGLQSVPPEQRQRINKKFEDFGVTNAFRYVGGYALGIVEGIGLSIKGLVEAVITLIKLPYDINRFLTEKVPELAVRYGPRIAQFLSEGGGLSARINKVIEGFLKDPAKGIRQISSFLDALGNMALAQVRALGRGVAGKTLSLLEEPWFEYGLDIGKVVGQILFEVILAVASDAIANVVKEVLSIAGRISARLITGAVELIKSAGRFLGEAIEWVASLGRRAAGELGEMFEGIRAFLNRLRALIAELGEEGALAETGPGGARIPVPEAKPPVLESRMVKPPEVHPSNVPKEVPAPKSSLAEEAEGAAKGGQAPPVEGGTLAAKGAEGPWWKASNFGENWPGTNVPRGFDLEVGGQKYFVHPNATKHMAEYALGAAGKGVSASGEFPISPLAGAVEKAQAAGLQAGRNFITVGNWELGIDTNGNVIYHAVYRP